METLSLVLENIQLSDNRPTDSYAVDGSIFFRLGDVSIPEENWFDLVSVDLENWVPRLLSFAQKHTDRCVLSFMDGPACVTLIRSGANVFTSFAYGANIEVENTEFDQNKLIKSVIKCLRRYHRLLHQNGLQPRFQKEIEMLQACIQEIPYV